MELAALHHALQAVDDRRIEPGERRVLLERDVEPGWTRVLRRAPEAAEHDVLGPLEREIQLREPPGRREPALGERVVDQREHLAVRSGAAPGDRGAPRHRARRRGRRAGRRPRGRCDWTRRRSTTTASAAPSVGSASRASVSAATNPRLPWSSMTSERSPSLEIRSRSWAPRGALRGQARDAPRASGPATAAGPRGRGGGRAPGRGRGRRPRPGRCCRGRRAVARRRRCPAGPAARRRCRRRRRSSPAGRPSYIHSPAPSYMPQVAMTRAACRGRSASDAARSPVSGLRPPFARVAAMSARSRAVTDTAQA